jgi:site-specific recombinase XerD
MTSEQMKLYAQEFLQHLVVEKNVSEHTSRAYKADLKQFFTFWQQLPNSHLLSIKQIVERYLVSLFYKKIDNKTVARKFSCFSSFEKYLKTKSIFLHLELHRPRITKKLPIYLTIQEVTSLLDGVQNSQLPTSFPYRDRALFELLYATGVRCGEVAQITIADLDMVNKTIKIFGKGKKERIVLFGCKAAQSLELYLQHERQPIAAGVEKLFLNTKNSPLSTGDIRRIIIMFRQFLTISRPITPHKIRHSYATHLLQRGMDLRMVQELLGHQTLASTEIYTHISLEQLKIMCNTIHPLHTLNQSKKNKTE